jgi:hypothetical protein
VNRARPGQNFGSRKQQHSKDLEAPTQSEAVATDIKSRRTSMARDTEHRKLRWVEALRLARSGDCDDAKAVKAVLIGMGLMEPTSSFSDQDVAEINAVCARSRSTDRD